MACLDFFLKLKDHPAGPSTYVSDLIRQEDIAHFAMEQAWPLGTTLNVMCDYNRDVRKHADNQAELESLKEALEAERKKSVDLEIAAERAEAEKLRAQAAETALETSQAEAEKWKVAANHIIKKFQHEKNAKERSREHARTSMRRVNGYYTGLIEKMNRYLAQKDEAEKIIATTAQWKGADQAVQLFEKEGLMLPALVKDKVADTLREWEAKPDAFEEVSFEPGELRALTLDELFGEQRPIIRKDPAAPSIEDVTEPVEKAPSGVQGVDGGDNPPKDVDQDASAERTEEVIEKTGD